MRGVNYYPLPGTGTNGDNHFVVQLRDGSYKEAFIDPSRGIEASLKDIVRPPIRKPRPRLSRDVLVARLNAAGQPLAALAIAAGNPEIEVGPALEETVRLLGLKPKSILKPEGPDDGTLR